MKKNDIKYEDIYINFCSEISFFEFNQEEFRTSSFSFYKLKNEILELSKCKYWKIDELSEFIKKYPKSFFIFEALFQQLRFTNTQLIHFIFNIAILNSININDIYEYMILNLKYDKNFKRTFIGLLNSKISYEELLNRIDEFDKNYLIACFKMSISKYVNKVTKNFNILEERLKNEVFQDFYIRFANYLINNLKINDLLNCINIENFLKNKRIPLDIKSIHGKYAKHKVIKILEEQEYINLDALLDDKKIKTLECNFTIEMENKNLYCTERYIKGIIKSKDNKPKKFDVILFKNNKPKYLFEINFYSTEGTKIGINQNEYVDLFNLIKGKFPQYEFYWITDGNYWLTKQGKERFFNLLNYFPKILNINLFRSFLSTL